MSPLSTSSASPANTPITSESESSATSQQRIATHSEMSILEHLTELRKRLVWCAVAIACGAIFAFCFASELFHLLNAPYFSVFPNDSLIGTGPAEAFVTKLKVSIFAGIIVGSPIIFLQIWLFVAPGLHEHERRLVWPFVIIATILFLIGVVFCYRIVLPFAYEFFLKEYRSISVTANIRLTEQLSMVMQALLVFGTMFELPVLAYFLGRVGVITSQTMIHYLRHAILGIFILSAILTPPDVITQFLLAIPLLGLYGLSIAVVRFTEQRYSRASGEQS